MSKRASDDRDWGQASESLFRASRADHDPTAGDRARVRLALARRLASGAPLNSDGGALPAATRALRGATIGNVVKLALGVACVAAGAYVFTGKEEERPVRPATTESLAQIPAETPAKRLAPSIEMGPRATPTSSEDSLASHGLSGVPARGAPGRQHAQHPLSSAKMVAPQDSSSPRAESSVPSPPSTAAASTRSASTATTPPVPVESTDVAATPEPPHPDQLDDVRAELALVKRMHLAMRSGNLSDALVLCAEHERRWPHGTFAQEREGVRAIASCESGSRDAERRARAFLAKYPRATLAPRVAAACAAQLASPQGRAASGVD